MHVKSCIIYDRVIYYCFQFLLNWMIFLDRVYRAGKTKKFIDYSRTLKDPTVFFLKSKINGMKHKLLS